MCDYSLHNVLSRPAKVGDKLVTHSFGTGTSGFADAAEVADRGVTCHQAICILPGTELAFENVAKTKEWNGMFMNKKYDKVAVFRQINKDKSSSHHDALEFPDGQIVLLTMLSEGQHATVLQLPAAPKTEAEAEAQKRIETVG